MIITVLGSRYEKIHTAGGVVVGGLGRDSGRSQRRMADRERGREVNRLFRVAVIRC